MEENENQSVEESAYKKGIKSGILIGALSVLLLVLLVLLFKMLWPFFGADSTKLDNNTLSKMKKIQSIINRNMFVYNDDLDLDSLADGAYRGMVYSIGDVYADYYSPEDMEKAMNDYDGVSYGIGCYITINDDGIAEIYGVMEDTPAERAGVQNGDLILKVDGESVIGLSLDEVVAKVKGLEHTTVNIIFSRDDELIELELERAKQIEKDTVTCGQLLANEELGYIRIKEFDTVTPNQYDEAIEELKKENIKGLVLDIRNNPGGSLDSVVEIARKILPKGLVVYTEDSRGKRRDIECDGENELDIPLVVLVNSYSASAAEILAGAIQDYNKGTLVGTTTFGKGIVQTTLSVGDGSYVKLTTSAYFTPSGRYIQDTGIEPDVVIELDEKLYTEDSEDNQVNKAVEILEQKIGK